MKNVLSQVKPETEKIDQKMHQYNTIEFLPEKDKQESYNKTFYKNLEDLKIIDVPIDPEKKLFYHFETNTNASITSTITQIQVTSEQLAISNLDTYKEIKILEEEIEVLKKEIEIADTQFYDAFRPEIIKMRSTIQNSLVEQKTENFKLVKEIAILEKEKTDLHLKIYEAISKIMILEKDVGMKPTTLSYQMDSIIEQKLLLEDH